MNSRRAILMAVWYCMLASRAFAFDPLFNVRIDYGVGSFPVSVCGADLDGNGHSHLAVANYYSDNVSILMNNGPSPVSVLIESFAAQPSDAGVELVWAEFWDEGIKGYRIYREEEGSPDRVLVNQGKELAPSARTYKSVQPQYNHTLLSTGTHVCRARHLLHRWKARNETAERVIDERLPGDRLGWFGQQRQSCELRRILLSIESWKVCSDEEDDSPSLVPVSMVESRGLRRTPI